MKIAVQLFGHLRTFEQCYKNLKSYLLDKYDCDVFMHTWDTIDHNTLTWHSNYMSNATDNTLDLEEFIKNIYKLKGLKIEHQNIEDLGNIVAIDKKISIYGMQCMFHSMTVSNQLREKYQKETGTKYDFVICLRPDVLLNSEFNINYYLERMSVDEINKSFYTYFFPMVGLWNDLRKIGACDVFFFSKPEIISNIYNNIDFVINKLQPDLNINYGPETYFLDLVKQLKYDIKLIKYDNNTEFIIKRGNKAKKTKKKFIKIKLSLRESYIILLPSLQIIIFNLEFNLFNIINIKICIGDKNG